jgi:hypothetical protein
MAHFSTAKNGTKYLNVKLLIWDWISSTISSTKIETTNMGKY